LKTTGHPGWPIGGPAQAAAAACTFCSGLKKNIIETINA
jgi:hypothetical protein